MRNDWKELWKYRSLILLFVERDLQARYKQTFLGIGWSILQPLLMMMVLTVIFANFLKVDSGGVPYPIFSYAALVPWTFVSRSLTASSVGLLTYKSLITKIYFPREIIPLSMVLSSLVDFFLASCVFVLMMIVTRTGVGLNVLYVLMLIPAQLLLAAALALLMSFLGALLRDLQFVLPFLIQIWMYATPVIYGLQSITSKYMWLFYFNPLAGIIDGYRRTVLFNQPPDWSLFGASLAFSVVLFLVAYLLFKKVEGFLIDVL